MSPISSPYLLQVEQEGLFRHVDALCRAVGVGVIVYHRDNSLFEVDTMRRLCEAHAGRRPAGPVRAPPIDLTAEEDALLAALIERTKEQ